MVYAYVPEHFLSCKELSYLDKLVYIRIVGFCRNEEYNYTCFALFNFFGFLFTKGWYFYKIWYNLFVINFFGINLLFW